MDAKDLRTEAAPSDRNNDGPPKYSQSSVLACNRNKPYVDVATNSLGKVEGQSARPCAVIGPDRIVPPPAAEAFNKRPHVESWVNMDNACRRPPDYPLKMVDYQHPTRNISPRQTFQENMSRIMIPPTYNSAKLKDEHNFSVDANVSTVKNKISVPTDTKYCNVPYTSNPVINDQKTVRNTDISVTNINPTITRSAAHTWPPVSLNARPPKPYGAPDMYQYPDFTSCAGPRPTLMSRPHRTINEEPKHVYPETYYNDGSLRYKPYPSAKERYPQPRYDYVNNYTGAYHPPPPFPSHKYDMQKAMPPNSYPGYSQVPVKYLDSRIPDQVMNGYQRQTQQANFNAVTYQNQIAHPPYGIIHNGGLTSNKLYPPYPPEYPKSVVPNKLPYDMNSKIYAELDISRSKPHPNAEPFYINEISRSQPMKSQVLPPSYHLTANIHRMNSRPYYSKDSPSMKNYVYGAHFKNDPTLNMNPLARFPSQYPPNTVGVSPSDSTLNNNLHQIQGIQEDYLYTSHSSSNNIRHFDSSMVRTPTDPNRRYDYRYGPVIRPSKNGLNSDAISVNKDKKEINVRQFLQMWNEGEDENGENKNKESGVQVITKKPHELSVQESLRCEGNKQEQLYVLGLVNVPSEELGKYEHIQKVSKLPENIKGYNSIDILHKFEEAIESSNLNNFSSTTSRNFPVPLKSPMSQLPGIGIPSRPLSPLDVEAKISQSVIHKEVGCNFEIKPCSPKMLNVELAMPVQNIIDERAIEKVKNTRNSLPASVLLEGKSESCKVSSIKYQDHKQNVSSCKMDCFNSDSANYAKTNYSLQDLESNSGVCLASLPRLDNDIELTFPEVNQQFINANKVETVITPTPAKQLTELDGNQKDVGQPNIGEENTTNQLPPKKENEHSKLSKYRKLKNKVVEPPQHIIQSNAQAMRKDSVIIKNPEKPKVQEESYEKISDLLFNSTTVFAQQDPINLTVSNNNLNMLPDYAIDFSMPSNPGNKNYEITKSKIFEASQENSFSNDEKPGDINDSTVGDSSDYNVLRSHKDLHQYATTIIESPKDQEHLGPRLVNNDEKFCINSLSENPKSSPKDDPSKTTEETDETSSINIDKNNIKNFSSSEKLNVELEKSCLQNIGIKQTTSENQNYTNVGYPEVLNNFTKPIQENQSTCNKSTPLETRNWSIKKELYSSRMQNLVIYSEGRTKSASPALDEIIECESCDRNKVLSTDTKNINNVGGLADVNENSTSPKESNSDNDKAVNLPQNYFASNSSAINVNDIEAVSELSNSLTDNVEFNNENLLNSKSGNDSFVVNTQIISLNEENHTKNCVDLLDENQENYTKNCVDLLDSHTDECSQDVAAADVARCDSNNPISENSGIKSSVTHTDDTSPRAIQPVSKNISTETIETILESQESTNIIQENSTFQSIKKSLESIGENQSENQIENYHEDKSLHLSKEYTKSNESNILSDACNESDLPKTLLRSVETNEEKMSHILNTNSISNTSGTDTIVNFDNANTVETALYDLSTDNILNVDSQNNDVSTGDIDYGVKVSNMEDELKCSVSSADLIRKKANEICLHNSDITTGKYYERYAINQDGFDRIDETKNESETLDMKSHKKSIQNSIQTFTNDIKINTNDDITETNDSSDFTAAFTINSFQDNNLLSNSDIRDDDLTVELSCSFENNVTDSNTNIDSNEEDSALQLHNIKLIKDDNFEWGDKDSHQKEKVDQQDVELNSPDFFSKIQLRLPSRKTKRLKRTLSESALEGIKDSIKDDVENTSLIWPNKRQKVAPENDSGHFIAQSYCNIIHHNRRKSVHQENFSFCILIDNDCILTNEFEDSQKICYTEVPEDCITSDIIDEINGSTTSEVTYQEGFSFNHNNPIFSGCEEQKFQEDSWVDDVACVETVVSEDIHEDIVNSETMCQRNTNCSDYESSDESEYLKVNSYTNKVKYIYGDKLCSNDADLVDTLYRTPQMNVNKTLINRESFVDVDYYDDEALEKVLSETNIPKKSNHSDFEPQVDLPLIESATEKSCDNSDDTAQYSSVSNKTIEDEDDAMHNNYSKPMRKQGDRIDSCDLTVKHDFSCNEKIISSSPEVSSTTPEDKNSGILLKIKKYGGSRVSEINNYKPDSLIKRIGCKYTEQQDYCRAENNISPRPLITKAAQKYIPPLKETLPNLKIQLPLPPDSLYKLKQLKFAKEKPKHNTNKVELRKGIPKKPKPKFEDVLKSIDEIQFQKHRESNKKIKNCIPKVVIKKNGNGSHYASTSNRDKFNPDLTGRKWQPWVFLEKVSFIDRMALGRQTHAKFNHRKKCYILADKFKKYRSIAHSKFVISQPVLKHTSTGKLKYTIRLQHP